jgi:hypothetical protein
MNKKRVPSVSTQELSKFDDALRDMYKELKKKGKIKHG